MSGRFRFDAIHLPRYGALAEARFVFEPPSEGDLQLVIGPNEAGKTTLRHAIIDALHGIPRNTAYDFDALPLVEAEFSFEGEHYRVEHKKGGKEPRPKPAAAALSSALLAAGLDRKAYVAAHAFSHRQMVEDADELAKTDGDFKKLLIRSAAGLDGVEALRKALKDELDALFVKHAANKKALMRVLRSAWKREEADYLKALVPAEEIAALEIDLERAKAALDKSRADQHDARTARERLQLVAAQAGSAARIGAIDTELEGLGPARLEEGAAERVDGNVDALTGAEKEAARLSTALERIDAQLEGLAPDEAVLSVAAEIDRLADEAKRLADRRAGREAEVANRDAARRDALRRARDAGLSLAEDADLDAFVKSLPNAKDRQAALKHLRAKA
ncbi:MAG: AAA family ATPase, partial [Pseudomonadota bacterium]